jgi:alpha-beta hydrolase superfamily lysophospholipase
MSNASKMNHVMFLQGINTFERASQVYPVMNREDQGLLFNNGVSTAYYLSRAKNEKALVVGISGLDSHFLLDREEIEHLNARGLSVIWMANPLPDHDDDPFMERNTALSREFLTNEISSPVFRLFDLDLPRYLLTHSTGGQITLKLMQEDIAGDSIAQNYSGAMHMAPYLDSANASVAHSRAKQVVFEIYSNMNKRKRSQETTFGKIYLKYFAANEYFSQAALDNDDKSPRKNGPTYGHIMEVQSHGRRLMESFNGAAVNRIPNIFVIGAEDKMIIPGVGHDPMYKREDLRNVFIGKVDECVASMAKTKARHAFQDVPPPMVQYLLEDLPEYVPSLRDRARLALQSSASLFNAGTSFAQSLLTRSI